MSTPGSTINLAGTYQQYFSGSLRIMIDSLGNYREPNAIVTSGSMPSSYVGKIPKYNSSGTLLGYIYLAS